MSSRPVLPVLLLTSLFCGTTITSSGQATTRAVSPLADSTSKTPPLFHTTASTTKATDPKLPASPDPVDAPDFLVGLVASRADDYAAAAKAFSAALAADPNDPEIARQAFTQSALAGDPNAVTLARESAKHPGGRTILTAFVIGNDAALHGRWQDAATAYKAMPNDALTQLLAPLLQAWCLAGEHKSADAIRQLTAPSTSASPAMPFYLVHAGLIAALNGETILAGRLYDDARRQMPGRDLLLTRALGNWLWQSGRQTEARDLMRQMTSADTALAIAAPELQAALSTPPVTTPQQGLAHAYMLVAFLMHQQAEHVSESEGAQQINVAAAMMLRMALTLDPPLAIGRLMLAEVEQDLGHKDVAATALSGIAPTDPLIRVAQYRRALLDDTLGHTVAARQTLEALVHDEPQQVLPSRALGTLLFEQKDWPAAITAFSHAVDTARASHTLEWTLLFERAAAYERTGDWSKAEADLQAARQMMPDEPLLLNFLGYGWIQRGQHQQDAIALLERALSLDPDDGAIRDSLGWACLRTGNVAKAVQLLEHAAEQTPLDAEVNYHLGVAYWDLGRKTEAIDQWNIALGLKPEADDLVRIQSALAFVKSSPDATAIPLENAPSTPGK
ncbi:tetratricopeptide repeat protein [Acetobacter fallax]|uniref:Tetratricopeptide repeat protein n=1 Tax=Acetobacter fallax TaxID=1737473 RepID=A0ABX0KHJ0_9PROT|nr:tetratricopeptide repeat protein [Acetobacter fallax]NHO33870.1 tetratricopeptide repeat protein [Acetobacter fallax]NHO37448.1 tetratricopeptide repeat protein [Acetobacter fallax]